MFFLQPQYMIQSEFFLPSLHQKAVRIDQEKHQNNDKKTFPDPQHHPCIAAPWQNLDNIILENRHIYKIGTYRKDSCRQIREIHISVSEDTVPCHDRQNSSC